jgi:hypothetical protein
MVLSVNSSSSLTSSKDIWKLKASILKTKKEGREEGGRERGENGWREGRQGRYEAHKMKL